MISCCCGMTWKGTWIAASERPGDGHQLRQRCRRRTRHRDFRGWADRGGRGFGRQLRLRPLRRGRAPRSKLRPGRAPTLWCRYRNQQRAGQNRGAEYRRSRGGWIGGIRHRCCAIDPRRRGRWNVWQRRHGQPFTSHRPHGFGLADRSEGIALQANGGILVANRTASGHFGLVRLNPTGTVDTDFGTNGLVTANFGGDDDADAVIVQSTGQIIVVGTSLKNGAASTAVAVYDSVGNPLTTFGSQGVLTMASDVSVARRPRKPPAPSRPNRCTWAILSFGRSAP